MSSFGFHSTAEAVTEGIDLTGQCWVITGVNSGLGRESARVLAQRGAHIIGLARTGDSARSALGSLGVDGTAVACELSDLDSVRAAARSATAQPVHGIMANAGVMALPTLRQTHGIEQQLFVNHVGHFELVRLLQPALQPHGRIVVLSSEAHRMADKRGLELDNAHGEVDYHPWRMYGRAKLANILFARALAARLTDAGNHQTANAVHPGVIRTNLARHVANPDRMFDRMKHIEKTVQQGAATQCSVAVRPEWATTSGAYFSDCVPLDPIAAATDDALAEALWAWTEQLIARI